MSSTSEPNSAAPLNDIYGRLSFLIHAKKLTPYGFSKQLGFDKPAKLYTILRGKVKPSFDTLLAVVTTFEDVNADWLLKGTGEPLRVLASLSLKTEIEGQIFETTAEIATAAVGGDAQAVAVLQEKNKGMERLLDEREQTIALLKEQIVVLREVIQSIRTH